MSEHAERTASNDAVGALLDDHRRIRDCLELVQLIADGALGSREAIEEAAVRVERYVTRKLPLHVHDEEESVAPRLYGREQELDVALEAMVRDHRDQERPFAVLVTACKEIARAPAQLSRLAPYLRRALEHIRRLLARHLDREETIVYPALRRFLDASAEAQIVSEMRARRAVVGC